MYIVGATLGGVFTFLVFPAVLFLAAARFLRADDDEAPGLFLMALPAGPITIAWILYVLFHAIPHQPAWVYFAIIGVVTVLAGVWGRGQIPQWALVGRAMREIIRRIAGRPRTMNHFVASLAVFVWLIGFIQCLLYPMYANDPIEYAVIGEIVNREKSLEMYPLTKADPVKGVILGTAHPPANVLLIAWTYMLQGRPEFVGLARWIQGVHGLWIMLLVWYLLRDFPALVGSMANLVLISTPLFFTLMTSHAIEPIRIATFTLSFVWLAEALDKPATPRRFIAAGVIVGLSMFSHSIGFFTAPFFVVTYGLLSRSPMMQRARYAGIAMVTAVALGGWQYLSNFLSYGTPFVTTNPLAPLEDKLGIEAYALITRRLIHPSDILLNGVLRPFVRIEMFGLSFFLAVLALAFYHRTIWNDPRGRLAVVVALMNYAFILAVAASGGIGVFGNSRYMLTALPFVAAAAGILLGRVYETYAKA